jgi:hypothetical protein
MKSVFEILALFLLVPLALIVSIGLAVKFLDFIGVIAT